MIAPKHMTEIPITSSANFQSIWAEVHGKITHDTFDITDFLREPFEVFYSIPVDSKAIFLKIAVSSWDECTNENHLHQFFVFYLDELLKYLQEDLNRIDLFINSIQFGIESPHIIQFLTIYASVFPSFFPDPNSIDLNLLLAMQSPIFSYSVHRNPESEKVCILWFHSLASSHGSILFKDNLPLAMSYFKLMNHAFFQLSITTTQAAQQEELFVNAQKAMKSAIVSIARILDE